MRDLNAVMRAVRGQLLERGFELAESPGSTDLALLVPTSEGPRRLVVHVNSSPGRADRDLLESGLQDRSGTEFHESRILAETYVAPRRARLLKELGVPYIDTVGNMWLDLPGLHIAVEGRPPPPSRPGAETGDRLSRPSSLRITFALLTQPWLLQTSLRELADRCGTSLGAAQAATADLTRTGYLHGKIPDRRLRRTGRLADRWVNDFRTRLLPKLEQHVVRGPAPQWWFERRHEPALEKAAFGGESACELLGYSLRSIETLLYGSPPWGAIRKLGRLGAEGDFTVTLREQFWPPPPDPRGTTASLLVYADLLAAEDPRLDEMATAMRERDDDLRRIWAG